MISYAILTHNEGEYINNLLTTLINYKQEDDEVVVVDDFSDDPLTIEILEDFKPYIKFYQREFDGDASSKNYLNSLCKGDVICQLDADEMLNYDFIKLLPQLLEDNKDIDLFIMNRINTVENLALSKVREWGWNISKNINFVKEDLLDLNDPQDQDEYDLLKLYDLLIEDNEAPSMLHNIKYYIPIINFGDSQMRIFRNSPDIKWEGLLHSKIIGYKTFTTLPENDLFCILHHKKLERQTEQNNLYNKIEQTGRTKYKV